MVWIMTAASVWQIPSRDLRLTAIIRMRKAERIRVYLMQRLPHRPGSEAHPYRSTEQESQLRVLHSTTPVVLTKVVMQNIYFVFGPNGSHHFDSPKHTSQSCQQIRRRTY